LERLELGKIDGFSDKFGIITSGATFQVLRFVISSCLVQFLYFMKTVVRRKSYHWVVSAERHIECDARAPNVSIIVRKGG